MIDLHSHTTESDGSVPPLDLIAHAAEIGLEALAITDHDTFTGFEAAVPAARNAGLELLCGIELSTKFDGHNVHLLAYFPDGAPREFRHWVIAIQQSRRERNERLAARLQGLGIDITVEEAQAKGRSMTGRPHFARVLVEKGYASSIQDAFDRYIGESGSGFVEREGPRFDEAVRQIRASGGISSLAHPIRLGRGTLQTAIRPMIETGLQAIEVWHSDHSPERERQYLDVAREFGLRVTGGSDFHGDVKPGVRLGTGKNNLAIPRRVLDDLRR